MQTLDKTLRHCGIGLLVEADETVLAKSENLVIAPFGAFPRAREPRCIVW